MTLRIAFVMEQHLGHATYAANLRRSVTQRDDVIDRWFDVGYVTPTRASERLPGWVRGPLRGRAEVARAFDGRAPDVAVFNTQVPATLGPRRARRAPFVLCSDVTPRQQDELADGYGHRRDRLGPVRDVKHAWNVRVARLAARHAPWSNWVAGSLADDYGVDPARIQVIAPGVDLQRWRPPERDRPPEGPLRILMVAGDFERKGGGVLLQAVQGLSADEVVIHVVTRSSVPVDERVVVHHGLTPGDDALIEQFHRADVFVLPSRAETFGIAAVEAAAAGLPAIVSAVGGLPETVENGLTGITVRPDDGRALREAIDRLRGDRLATRAMGARARRRAEQRFDAHANAEQLIELARDAAGVSRAVAGRPAARGHR